MSPFPPASRQSAPETSIGLAKLAGLFSALASRIDRMKCLRPILAMLALMIPFALYVGGYFVVFERQVLWIDRPCGSELAYRPMPRFGGQAVERLYIPLVELDCFLRPNRYRTVNFVDDDFQFYSPKNEAD